MVPDRTEIPLIQVSASAVPAVVGLLGGLSPSATSIRLDQMVFSSAFAVTLSGRRTRPRQALDRASCESRARRWSTPNAPSCHLAFIRERVT